MADKSLILLVEDSEDDVILIRRAFLKANIYNPIQVVNNAQDAIAYLKGEGLFSNRTEFPLPDLVLLDLKMPGTDGFEVLTWIRLQPGLTRLRVVVLTSCAEASEVSRAYALGANSLLLKPLDFSELVGIALALQEYWFEACSAPEVSHPSSESTESSQDDSHAAHVSTPSPHTHADERV